MTAQIIVVETPAPWLEQATAIPVVSADDYLTGADYFKARNVQVINLCRSYRYLSVGYYCSLLGEARRHRPVPAVRTMLDLSSKSMYSLDAGDLDESIQKSLRRQHAEQSADEFTLVVFFGQCPHPALRDLARQLFELFPCPLLSVNFRAQERWRITTIKALPLQRLAKEQWAFFLEALDAYQQKRWRAPRGRRALPYDLAILHNPHDPLPPSDERALKKFIKAGRELGVAVELIERRDYARLAEYDALFIRDTTRINHYTYRFAKKAESEGLVVIDDPQSILRCTNKVYLAELLRANKVPTPRTVIAGRNDLEAAIEAIGFPMVLKVPDGSFSQGVYKAENADELQAVAERLLRSSELILAQEFLYTEFDWRIGVLNRQPIYACQYFMSKRHWQIVHYDAAGGFTEGAFKTWAVEAAPQAVVQTALKAANLIGDGLYGVDLKQGAGGVYVIEVNDNPNLEAGVEDGQLKGELYRLVMQEFVRRIEARRGR